MQRKSGFISAALFGLIILCFFLPFIAISCSGQEIASLSGFKLATGTSITNPMDGSVAQVVESNVILIIGLLCAVAGIVFGIIKMGGLGYLLSALSGIIGFVMLLIFKLGFSRQVTAGMASMGELGEIGDIGKMLKIEYKIGFWLSFILFLAAAGYNVYLIKNKTSQQADNINTEAAGNTSAKFCSVCGAKLENTAAFCSECGAKTE